MFGYIIINKQEMKFREFDLYRSWYCGFCQELKAAYGKAGQMTLSYDLTFLILLLTSLYEPETVEGLCKCAAHPFEKHPTRTNEFSRYAADMNLLLSYYKCVDDWLDEKKVTKRAFSSMLKKKVAKIRSKYPKKAGLIADRLNRIHQCEKASGQSADKCKGKGSRTGKAKAKPGDKTVLSGNVDEIAGYFGDIMAEIFAWRKDEWEQDLRRMGFFMGKFIYLMDAYEDVEKDEKEGAFNPLLPFYHTEGFEERCETMLTMMMADCSRVFEKLPLIEYVEILRNILYSGVWCRYEMVKGRRAKAVEKRLKKSDGK